MKTSISAALAGARFFGRLPLYLLRRIAEKEARANLTARLASREHQFLERLSEDIYARRHPIYEPLLRCAGCTYGDIEEIVRTSGIEAALESLFESGVYLTVDEFKGRQPIVRGSSTIEAGPDLLRSPRAAYHLPGSSGGSRSSGTPVLFDLRFVRDCASNLAVSLHSRGGVDWAKSDWETVGGGARFRLIQFAAFGRPPEAWFSQIDPHGSLVPATARWSERAMRLAGAAVGRPFPAAQFAPLSDPAAVLNWIAAVLASGREPLVFTFPSSAVRACLAALESGLDLTGTRFKISGEPITDACIATIRKAGATPIARYGSMEVGAIGYGCLEPRCSDDLHILNDMQGLIQAGAAGPAVGLPERALLTTSLHPQSPFLMLNVSMGDEATLSDRRCGCALERAGWTRHISAIRSYEKLTALGVTFLSGEIIPVLERLMPDRLGGGPTNYQLVETETSDGQPRVELRVDPAIGDIADEAIMTQFCSAVESLSRPAAQRMLLWRDAGTLKVVRQPPIASQVGKILHVHRVRSAHAA